MTTTSIQDRVDELFADARDMQAQAVNCLDRGDVRDAAEKAWCAAKRAVDALILARTGQLPPKSPNTTRALLRLAQDDPRARTLQDRYFTRQSALHGDCFYTGACEPLDAIHRLIRETAGFIEDAQILARS